MIYFDNNSTTMMAPEAESVYVAALRQFGNSSSPHEVGRQARRRLEESREKIAALLKAPESSLIFTSGGTESLNAAILGVFLGNKKPRHLIVSAVEHSAVLETARFLNHRGIEITYLQVDGQGALDSDQVEQAIRPDTGLIAVMLANNEIGNIYPVKKIGEIARRHGILYLCDAVQAMGKIPIDLSLLPIDLVAASAHKFHGPKGVGLLYIHPKIQLPPLLRGGRQERGRRAGTENIAGVVAMAQALELAHGYMLEDERRISRLRDRLQNGIMEKIPGGVLHGDLAHRLANTLNIRWEGVSGETTLMNLDMAGIAVGLGAACESGSIEPSHVLLAMGISPREAMGGLRFSLSRYNTEADVDQALEIIPQVVERIRAAA